MVRAVVVAALALAEDQPAPHSRPCRHLGGEPPPRQWGVQVTLTLTADGLFNEVVTSTDLGTTISTFQGTWILTETATSDTFVLTLSTADQVFLKGPILQLNGPNQFIFALTSPGLITFVRQH
jgi:hypothetical protein